MKQPQVLFLPLPKLREIHERSEERFQRELFGSVDDEPLEPITRASLEKEFGGERAKSTKGPPYRDGCWIGRASLSWSPK